MRSRDSNSGPRVGEKQSGVDVVGRGGIHVLSIYFDSMARLTLSWPAVPPVSVRVAAAVGLVGRHGPGCHLSFAIRHGVGLMSAQDPRGLLPLVIGMRRLLPSPMSFPQVPRSAMCCSRGTRLTGPGRTVSVATTRCLGVSDSPGLEHCSCIPLACKCSD